ncbi:MAG: pyridoxamine 5'-phosphate oxidase family protein [Hyphomicrobiaceae bacterium]
MGYKFAEIAFTPRVRAEQERAGSRAAYARREAGDGNPRDRFGPDEAAFIAARDSFYLASVSETGWPYVQHRGGTRGFLRVLDDKTLGFADYAGNRQYVSLGNIQGDDRVSLFLMDYANRARMKIMGRMRVVDIADASAIERLTTPDATATIERGFIISVEAYDWNCSKFITERYSEDEVRKVVSAMSDRIAELESEVRRLRGVSEVEVD